MLSAKRSQLLGSAEGGARRMALLSQLSSDTSMESLDHKAKHRKPIKVRSVAGLDRRVLVAERIFLLGLGSVGLLLHGLWEPNSGVSDEQHAATGFDGADSLVDAALAPFAVGGTALLQAGLAVMLAAKKFTDPRLWAELDALSATVYVAYVAATSAQSPASRNIATLTLSILAAVFHTAMIVQDALAFRRLHWALKLSAQPETSGSITSYLSEESLRAAGVAEGGPIPTPSTPPPTSLPPSSSSPPLFLQPSLHTEPSTSKTSSTPTEAQRHGLSSKSAASTISAVSTAGTINPPPYDSPLQLPPPSDVSPPPQPPMPTAEPTDEKQGALAGTLPGTDTDTVRRYPEDDPVHGRRTSWNAP